jgi:hypothetical protein
VPKTKKAVTLHPVSFRFTKEERALLTALEKATGNPPKAIVVRGLRKLARSEGVSLKT